MQQASRSLQEVITKIIMQEEPMIPKESAVQIWWKDDMIRALSVREDEWPLLQLFTTTSRFGMNSDVLAKWKRACWAPLSEVLSNYRNINILNTI